MANPPVSPKVSIVLPTYNGSRYLRESIQSCLDQEFQDWELVIVDDASTDGTVAVANSYRNQVRLLSLSIACGPPATRNQGLAITQGEFVAFLDADDLWHPEKLVTQAERFQRRPELDFCVSYVQMFWTETLHEEKVRYEQCPRVQPVPGYATTALLAKRSTFDRMGSFNENYWYVHATDWFLRAIEEGLVMEVLPQVLTYHRMHESNLARRENAANRDEFLNVMKASLDRRRHRQKSTSPMT